jgi:hypothetical protein
MISLDNMVKNSISKFKPSAHGTEIQASSTVNSSAQSPFLPGTEPIHEGFQWISENFEKLETLDMKNALKNALVDAEIMKIEDAVTREAAILSMNVETRDRKNLAVKRIEEGMDFWQRKILQKISGADR